MSQDPSDPAASGGGAVPWYLAGAGGPPAKPETAPQSAPEAKPDVGLEAGPTVERPVQEPVAAAQPVGVPESPAPDIPAAPATGGGSVPWLAQSSAAAPAPAPAPPVGPTPPVSSTAPPTNPTVVTPSGTTMPPLVPPSSHVAGRPARAGGVDRRLLVGAAAFVAVVVLAGAGWMVLRPDDGSPTAVDSVGQTQQVQVRPSPLPTPVPTPTPTPTPTATPTPTPTSDPEQDALRQLDNLHQMALQRLTLDGRWVAQVASKSVGIVDPLQTTRSGSHQFFAVDILAESDALRSTMPDPSQVLLLQSVDFGKRRFGPNGQPLWVTVVDGGFSDIDAVKAWCDRTFSYLDATARQNQCAPRQLTLSHD